VPSVKFSIVLPIHNEEENLRYTLKSLFDLLPDEVIAVLDNCTDHSKQMLEAYTRKINYSQRNTQRLELPSSLPLQTWLPRSQK
jgi:glycosyltransferase involved in cell wall biosynthesis